METRTLVVTVSVDSFTATPMALDAHLESVMNDIRREIETVQAMHEGILYQDWDEPRPVKLSIGIEEKKDG